MDWITGLQRAVDYVEEHLTEEIDYEAVAAESFSSPFHFQRVFSLLCGYTLGEYIRCRRLALAGAELARDRAKVIDTALKYGYDSPDSFAKAFQKFHGITPSQARSGGAVLKTFSRLSIRISLEGGSMMNYRIEEKPEMILTGYKKRFTGVPMGGERKKQEEEMFVSTRAKQWLLQGMDDKADTEYCVVTNMADDGYDFYIAHELRPWSREHMYDHNVTGVDFMEEMGFEDIVIPARRYAVFLTEECRYPTDPYVELRQRIAAEWLPQSGYRFADAPEIAVYHWYSGADSDNRDKRYIEIWMPVE